VFFNEAALHFDSQVVENKVYLFSGGKVTMANKKFSSIPNDFTIWFNKTSKIEPVADDGQIQRVSLQVNSISSLESAQQAKLVDVIGVVVEAGQKDSIKLKDGSVKDKRNIQIMDASHSKVVVSFWGEEACEQVKVVRGDIIAIKGAKVSEYGGKSLNCSGKGCQVFCSSDNLDLLNSIPEAAKLLKWKKDLVNQGRLEEEVSRAVALSEMPGERKQVDDPKYETDKQEYMSGKLRLISEVLELMRGQEYEYSEKAEYFTICAFCPNFPTSEERILYQSCPNEGCNKKVVADFQGFRCEKCNMTLPNSKPCFMTNLAFQDSTDKIFINFSMDQAEKVFGMSAQEFKEMKDRSSEDQMVAFFDSLSFKKFTITVRAKYNTYGGNTSLRFFAARVNPADYETENMAMRKRIAYYKSKPLNPEAVGEFREDDFGGYLGEL
jgi:replication factor A1